jgi:hypothetical protein
MNILSNLYLLFSLITGHQMTAVGNHIYGIQRGAVYYHVRSPLGEKKTVVFFKDYGEAQLIQTESRIGGLIRISILQLGDTQYSFVDPTQGIKTPRKVKFDFDNLVFNSLDSDIVERDEIRKAGTFLFLNRTCTKYTFRNKPREISGYVVEWQGIPLIIDISNHGRVEHTEAFKIDTGSPVSSKLFQLPNGMQIIDNTH